MTRHLTNEELAQYAEYLQSDKKADISHEVLEHIQTCDDCATEAIEFSFFSEDVNSNLENISKPKSIFKKHKIIFSVAAALTLIASLAIILNHYSKNSLNNNSTITEIADIPRDSINQNTNDTVLDKDTSIIRKIQDPDLYAANYIADPQTEQLIQNLKGNMRSSDIKVISDFEVQSSIGSRIKLEWQNPNRETISLVIYDNKLNEVIFKILNTDDFVIESMKNKGLFYWKLFNDDYDLLFCGKIIVK